MRSWAGIAVWATPGGRVERDETPLAAVRRELVEEVRLHVGAEVPVPLWRVETVSPLVCAGWDGSVDELFLVRCVSFEPQGALGEERLAAEELVAARWWTLAEIEASEEPFAPRDLAGRLRALLSG